VDYLKVIEYKKGMKRNILLEQGGGVRMMRFSGECHRIKRGLIHRQLGRVDMGMGRGSKWACNSLARGRGIWRRERIIRGWKENRTKNTESDTTKTHQNQTKPDHTTVLTNPPPYVNNHSSI
jgi:hypothetical protein